MRFLHLVSALLLSVSLEAATYEVAQNHPKANDGGPGTTEMPWKTLAQAARKAGPGDRVLIRDGTYRESVLLKTSGAEGNPVRFEAAAGAHVVLTGADLLTGWKKAEPEWPIYSITWPHRFITWSRHMTHPDDEYHRVIGRCEQVIIDNSLLRQVLERAQLAPGTFFVNVSNQVLEVWDAGSRDLSKLPVEASVRQEILRVEASHVQVRGLVFRFAANMAQHGAVVLAGTHNLLEDCAIEQMNASGATFSGPQHVVRRCVFRDNGQLGFGANGAHELLFTECLVENNNIKGFDRGWEAGGDKLVLSRDAILERSRFIRNRGNGIWFDIGNEHCTVRQCLIADNEDAGIFYEISFGLQAHDNVIAGNGFAATQGAWGAQAGISLSSSPDCVIERNLMVGNREGFNFREQSRTTPRIGARQEVPVWNHDQLIRNNIIAFNRDAQVWGWFDVKDNRHWPAEVKSNQSTSGGSPLGGRALPEKQTAGPDLSRGLAGLNLQFENNVYYAGPGQGAWAWGVPWGRHRKYVALDPFSDELGIDRGSFLVEPRFSNILARDFRLSSEQLRQLKSNYPRGDVPGVLLGVQ